MMIQLTQPGVVALYALLLNSSVYFIFKQYGISIAQWNETH